MNQELIGVVIEIINSTNQTVHGQKGKVVDETKNTITIETEKGNKKLIKKTITFKLCKNKGFEEKIIEGNTITKRSYERIK